MSTTTATHSQIFPPPEGCAAHAHIDSMRQYQAKYDRSINDPDGSWTDLAETFYWKETWSKVREFDFANERV